MSEREDWERLLAAERHVQHLVPGSVPVSPDGDNLLEELRERFDEVLAQLEVAAGWQGRDEEAAMTQEAHSRPRASWNRSRLDLGSDETLGQLMDRGEIEAWRELYSMAREDAHLRSRMHEIVKTVPLALPHFWLAALAALGEDVDFDAPLPAGET